MVQKTAQVLAELYEVDETAWLDATAELVRAGRLGEIDLRTLAEYLTDMAIRDRREVTSRLSVLITHLLKWHHQPAHRSGGWLATIEVQRHELSDILESVSLRNHATSAMEKSYMTGVRRAVAETGFPESAFPATCPYTLDELLSGPLDADPAAP